MREQGKSYAENCRLSREPTISLLLSFCSVARLQTSANSAHAFLLAVALMNPPPYARSTREALRARLFPLAACLCLFLWRAAGHCARFARARASSLRGTRAVDDFAAAATAEEAQRTQASEWTAGGWRSLAVAYSFWLLQVAIAIKNGGSRQKFLLARVFDCFAVVAGATAAILNYRRGCSGYLLFRSTATAISPLEAGGDDGERSLYSYERACRPPLPPPATWRSTATSLIKNFRLVACALIAAAAAAF